MHIDPLENLITSEGEEVDSLSPAAHARLLRFLQDHTYGGWGQHK